MSDNRTLQFYESHAAGQAEAYNSVTSPAVHHFHRAFNAGCRVLDAGCGSGRDVHTLRQLGFQAFGCDMSRAMIDEAFKFYPELEGRLECGFLPDNLLFDFLFSFYHLLSAGGSLLISFPVKYPGVTDGRDGKGRLFHIRPAEEVELLLERIGFDVVEKWLSDDGLGRGDMEWSTLFCSEENT